VCGRSHARAQLEEKKMAEKAFDREFLEHDGCKNMQWLNVDMTAANFESEKITIQKPSIITFGWFASVVIAGGTNNRIRPYHYPNYGDQANAVTNVIVAGTGAAGSTSVDPTGSASAYHFAQKFYDSGTKPNIPSLLWFPGDAFELKWVRDGAITAGTFLVFWVIVQEYLGRFR
jgi:hypothetical protein